MNSILRDDYVDRFSTLLQILAWLVTAIVLGFTLPFVTPWQVAVSGLATIGFYLLAGTGAIVSGKSMQLVPPLTMVSFLSTGVLLWGYLVRDRQRRASEQELAVARRIQQDLLPKGELEVRDVEVSGVNLPCFAVGGDYFDYFTLSDGRIALAIADVSGKGIPAAILMSNVQAILRAECSRGTDVSQVPAHTNRQLMESMRGNSKFVTFFYGALDPARPRLAYSNAGHNPPLVVRADGRVELLETGGLILGVFPFAQYDEGSIDLEPGDVVVLFTDGVTEAEGRRGTLYGDERLQNLVRSLHHKSAREIGEAICEDVARFSQGMHQTDDVTVVIAKVRRDGAVREATPVRATVGEPVPAV